jgi:uncharacterized membrane protein
MEGIAQSLFDFFSAWGAEVAVFFVAMCPLVELRLAIPIGCIAGLPWWEVFLLSVVGNLLPVAPLYFLLRPLFAWMKKTRLFRRLAEALERKIRSKSGRVTRYEMRGLILFVGVPLPGTGAWTGTGIAALLDLKPKKTFLSVVIGVLAAAVAVTLISYGVSGIVSFFSK